MVRSSVLCSLLVLAMSLSLASCVCRREASQVVTESKAMEIARREFARSGRDVRNYNVTAAEDADGRTWTFYFHLKTQYPPPGSDHFVTVDRVTGRALFMPGE